MGKLTTAIDRMTRAMRLMARNSHALAIYFQYFGEAYRSADNSKHKELYLRRYSRRGKNKNG